MSDASELMKAAHKRSKDNMEKSNACTPEGHTALIEQMMSENIDTQYVTTNGVVYTKKASSQGSANAESGIFRSVDTDKVMAHYRIKKEKKK